MIGFKEFLNEYSVNKRIFPANTRYSGFYDFPDLRSIEEPGKTPIGGHPNVSSYVQSRIAKKRYEDKDEVFLISTLEKIAALIESIRSSIELEKLGHSQNRRPPDAFFPNAYFDPNSGIIHGIHREEIIGGYYPRFRNQEMELGEELGIIRPDNRNPKLSDTWLIDTEKLRQIMLNYKDELGKKQHGYEVAQKLGSMADSGIQKTISTLLSPTSNIQRFHRSVSN